MIKPNIVKVPFRKLKHIHHISDIQIRNLKRHKEYEEVFERTYEEVRKNKDNAVAYIGGDIAHSKTDMSPELVDQLSRLFKNLADIVPTIIIAGNHDCNLNNRSRLDVLTPIERSVRKNVVAVERSANRVIFDEISQSRLPGSFCLPAVN